MQEVLEKGKDCVYYIQSKEPVAVKKDKKKLRSQKSKKKVHENVKKMKVFWSSHDLYELGGNGYGFDDNYVDYGDVQYDDAQHGSVEYNYEGGEGAGQVDKYGYDQHYDAHGYNAYA